MLRHVRTTTGVVGLVAASFACDPPRARPNFPDAACSAVDAGLAPDLLAAMREACVFGPGSRAIETLPLTEGDRAAIPIRHVLVLMQENRAFDHYYGSLRDEGKDVMAFPRDFSNPDGANPRVTAFHLERTCVDANPPHQWDDMVRQWNGGAMDGFVRNASLNAPSGAYAMGYFTREDIPFYYWLASTFAIGDRYFSSALSGTWTNRNFLYAGTSGGVRNTGERPLIGARTIFDNLDEAGVSWGVYTDGTPRQDTLGWRPGQRGVHTIADLHRVLADGTLPEVVFIDPAGEFDETPPRDVQRGEQWARAIYESTVASPLWPSLVLFFTYDESGGMFDHVPPPIACAPSADLPEHAQRGIRVPLIVVSPWARPGYVSHVVHEHTSILRFIELLHDLPALTRRDANSEAMLDVFDFSCPRIATPTQAPQAGRSGC